MRKKKFDFFFLKESLNQLEAELIDDTAIQLTAARGNERLTATLTDTMHEETQVIKKKTKKLNFIFFIIC